MLSSLTVVAFAASAAAVWRSTHLLVHESGPAGLLERLRAVAWLAPVLGCFYCCSLWTALVLAAWLGDGWVEVAVLCLGLSGSAIVIERLTTPRMPPLPAWHEAPAAATEGQPAANEEHRDVVLRS